MNKKQAIIENLKANGVRAAHLIAVECECSMQYVRSVVTEQRKAGKIVGDVWVRRGFVKPAELADAMRAEGVDYVILSPEKLAAYAQLFNAEIHGIQAGFDWGVSCCVFTEDPNTGYRGDCFRLAAA